MHHSIHYPTSVKENCRARCIPIVKIWFLDGWVARMAFHPIFQLPYRQHDFRYRLSTVRSEFDGVSEATKTTSISHPLLGRLT
jgi:hypothetical protein